MYSIEEIDKAKTKVLKYVIYKKRTESEVRLKFSTIYDDELLNIVIEDLVDNKYIDDKNYIVRAVNEFMVLKHMSLKEIVYKLYSKGLNRNLIDEYVQVNKEELVEYEYNCAKYIAIKKKSTMNEDEITAFLLKKGYQKDLVQAAIKEDE